MLSKTKKSAIGAVVVVAATGMMAPGAFGASQYKLSPPSTVITASETSQHLTSKGTIDGFPITVTCTTVTVKGKTPADGMVIKASVNPTITGCTDSLGGTDTVKTNSTNGAWKLAWSSPTAAAVVIPKAGATFSSSFLGAACTIVIAPSGTAKLKASFNNSTGVVTVTNQALPVAPSSTSSCTASSTATMNLQLSSSPKVSVVSNT
ncbi:MAG TPA: hypothetical protein VKU91_03315 [Acidimicrobiales bacterium]|nr:hypothetical protein [Acidimicrobiales bacterium]